jgi:hypothetical protein
MRSFILACIAVVVIATASAGVLSVFQRSDLWVDHLLSLGARFFGTCTPSRRVWGSRLEASPVRSEGYIRQEWKSLPQGWQRASFGGRFNTTNPSARPAGMAPL